MGCSSGYRTGVNGVWLHVVLRHLAPGSIFPEVRRGHEQRIENPRCWSSGRRNTASTSIST
jgi:hypothetical protein